jgi:uncharacterized protein involved in exopolysaccharide biosynthesis
MKRSFQISAVAGLVMAAFMIFQPNQYRSEARILPADQRSSGGLGGVAAAAAAVGVSLPGQDTADSAFVDILHSRSIREALLQTQFQFKVRTWYFGSPQARDQTLAAYLNKRNMDQAVQALAGKVSISRDFKTKLITIAAETESPELSQQMVKRLVHLLDEFVVNKAKTKGGAKAAFAERRLGEARADMAQAESTLQAFLEVNRNHTMSSDPAIRLKGARLEGELRLRAQLVTTLAIAREQALLEEKNDIPILNILDAGNLPLEKTKPARALWVLAAMAVTFIATWGWERRDWVKGFLQAVASGQAEAGPGSLG